MKIGAFDFMAKPIDENRLINAINHAVKIRELQDEVHILSTSSDSIDLNHPEAFDEIVTVSPAMKKIFRYVEAIAGSPKSVLITGESGTGKELIARAIHRLSGLSGKFVAVNVSGLDETMFSDTLFGHRRGAFTGADRSRSGLIEEAAGGTLFLDEIGDLQPGAQVKLLRLLQEEEYYPLGADQPARSTARIITATNADLSARQQQGSFRKDLYYRLMAHHVQLPPLRMRQEDIEPLVHYFVDESVRSLGKTKPRVPDEAYQTLRQYGFPGNVRELQSLIYDAVSRQDGGTLPLSFFRSYVHEQREREQAEVPNGSAAIDGKVINLRGGLPTLHEVEEHLIREALRRTGGNQSAAARLLGISQSTLSRRQQKAE
jgi:DNA-binding NtrC family response regulator